jgi:hypothetical protein
MKRGALPGVRCSDLRVSKSFIVAHVFPKPVLMQPNRTGILPDKLVDVHSIDFLRAPHPLPLPVHENRYELLPPLCAGPSLRCGQFPLRPSH